MVLALRGCGLALPVRGHLHLGIVILKRAVGSIAHPTPAALWYAPLRLGLRQRRVGNAAHRCDLSDLAFDPALESGLWRGADLVRHDLAILEQEQRRNAAHAHRGGRVWVLVDVDLYDLHPAFHFGRQLLERWADLFTGAAPLGPEIYDYGQVGLLHFGVEAVVSHGNGGHGHPSFRGQNIGTVKVETVPPGVKDWSHPSPLRVRHARQHRPQVPQEVASG